MSKSNNEWIFGIHALESAISQHPENILQILVVDKSNNSRLQKLINESRQLGLNISFVSMQNLNKRCSERHQGVIAEIKSVKLPDESDLKRDIGNFQSPLILVLDSLEDPRNLGACLRSADAAGVDMVLFAKHKAAGLTATARKTAAGAADTLKLYQVTNITNALKILKENGVWVAGTDCDAGSKSIYKTDLSGSLAIVMGNEGKGMRPLVKKQCDFLIHIPMTGTVQSLNVSVATGITLFEALRQRNA